MSKIIAFFVRNLDPAKLPFAARDLYYYSYQEYLLAMKQAGAEAYFVTDNATYLGDGRFSRAWTTDTVSEVVDFQEVGEIRADVVFEKGGFTGRDVPVVTDPRLQPLFGNKTALYERFSTYQPLSVKCMDAGQVRAAIEAMPGEMVVVKNPVGAGGRQVYIGTKDAIAVPPDETYPLLVQEFVDMSGGVPGLAAGVHDLRILLTGSTIIGATLRQPAAGSLYANVSQGGTEQLLSVDEIPQEVLAIAREIDAQLDDLPRYYAIDFARGKQGWVLIELNMKPGLFRQANGPLAAGLQRSVAQYIVGLV
jgi:glutathione synthase/RimK-type ligase-like ATP-grasp enzyme